MMRQRWEDGARIGLAGAVSVVAMQHAVQLAPALNAAPFGRLLARLALAGLAAAAAERLDAPRVATGIVAGAVLVSSLDAGVALVSSTPRRLDPPPVTDPARAGDPWAPRPPYAG